MLDSKCDDDIPTATATVFAAYPPLANTIEYEAIPELLFVDMQQENEEKVAAAVEKLARLIHTSNANWKVNADQALSLGAIAIILLLMRKWHYNKPIQLKGLCGLVLLTYYNPRSTAAEVSIIKSGGIETIMVAMKSFPDDYGIQNKGCLAIGNVFYDTNPTIDEAMTRFVHKLDGIGLVVPVMKKFQNNFLVQQNGCHVLEQLSKKQVLRDALKKGGALSAVSEATEKHNGNNLQSAATAFFKNMFN